jgi:hypothetical protein
MFAGMGFEGLTMLGRVVILDARPISLIGAGHACLDWLRMWKNMALNLMVWGLHIVGGSLVGSLLAVNRSGLKIHTVRAS